MTYFTQRIVYCDSMLSHGECDSHFNSEATVEVIDLASSEDEFDKMVVVEATPPVPKKIRKKQQKKTKKIFICCGVILDEFRSEGILRYRCTFCRRKYVHADSLHYSSSKEKSNNSSQRKKPPYDGSECELCHKFIFYKRNLSYHEKYSCPMRRAPNDAPTREKPPPLSFNCELCQKRIVYYRNLIYHRKYACPMRADKSKKPKSNVHRRRFGIRRNPKELVPAEKAPTSETIQID